MKITNAIILAAGLGLRLNPITQDIPKCMIKINNVSIIERSISIIKKYGIEKIIIVLGFQSKKIIELLGHSFKLSDFVLIENQEYMSTNNIVSLWLARKYLQDGAYIIESDVIFDEEAFKKLSSNSDNSMWMVDKFIKGMDGCLLTADNAGRIISIQIVREELKEYNENMYKSVGILKINSDCGKLFSEFLDNEITNNNKNIYYDLVLSKYISSLNISICNIEGYKWAEIDNIHDLNYAMNLFS